MNEDTLERVCRLAVALKQLAHLLLHHHHSLSLDTHTLEEVQEAFSLILEMEQHTNFHVLPPNHRQHPAIPHLQMVYDLLQKVAGLSLWTRQGQQRRHSAREPVVSLRCFRSLRTLEVVHVPVTRLRALQALRSQLRRIVVTHGLTSLADLFVCCGADQAGEFVWEQLREAILSHNALQGGHLDDSLRLLPNLRVLDISHCGLEDVNELQHLPSLSYLDLSHNRLPHLPHLPPTSSPALVVLLASHNLLHHLAGLQVMTGLEEVTLGHNFLATRSALVPLAALPRLRSLSLEGNPVTCDPAYRRAALSLLHPGIPDREFMLDSQPLSQQEQQLIGSVSSPPDLLHSLSSITSSPSSLPTSPPEQPPHLGSDEQPPSLPQETLSKAGQGTRKRPRKRRTRHIALGGEGEGEGEGESEGGHTPHPSHSPYPYIAPMPPTPTPNAAALLALTDETPAPPPSSLAVDPPTAAAAPPDTFTEALASLGHPRSHQEQNDRLLEEILQSRPLHTPTPPPLPHQPLQCSTTTTTGLTTAITTATVSADGGGGGEEEEEEEVVVVVVEEEETFYKALLERRKSVSPADSDGEEEEEGACLVLARRVRQQEEEEQQQQQEGDNVGGSDDVILSVASTQFKEKHAVSANTQFRWDLRCVESVEEVQPHPPTTTTTTTTIRMTFDTTRPTHKSRVYSMEREDFARLQAALNPILELNATCGRCLGQLLPAEGSQVRCPNCEGSDRPLPLVPPAPPLTSTPLHHFLRTPSQQEDDSGGDDGGGGGSGWPLHPPSRDATQPPTSLDGHPPKAAPHPQQDPGAMQDSSSSGSMTGSVCTAYERGGLGGPPSLPLTPNKAHQPQPPSSPQEPPPPPMDVTDAASELSSTLYFSAEGSLEGSISPSQLPLPSSSSGDMFKKEDEEEEEEEAGGGGLVSISPWVESLLHTLTGYHWRWWKDLEAEQAQQHHRTDDKTEQKRRKSRHKKKRNDLGSDEEEEEEEEKGRNGDVGGSWGPIAEPHNPVTYNFEDHAQVDHRLKLYLEVVVLGEPDEHLLGLVKAVMVLAGGRRKFHGLLVLSSHKYYLLEITGPEDDTPQGWLEVVLQGELGGVAEVHSLYQRQGVALSLTPTPPTTPTTLLICLADSHRANCFFNFLMEVLGGRGVSPALVEAAPTQEAALTAILEGEEEGEEGNVAPPTLLAIVSLLLEGGRSESQYLVINETDLVLYLADLTWFLPSTTTTTLATTATQKIHNVTAIEVHTPHHLSIHFLDELTQKETNWQLHVASPLVSWQVIEAVRAPWSDLFSVDLQVTRHTGQDLESSG